MRSIIRLKVRIMVSKGDTGKASHGSFKHIEHAYLGVLYVRSRKLVLAVMRDQVTYVDGPNKLSLIGSSSEWTDSTKWSKSQTIRRVTEISPEEWSWQENLTCCQLGSPNIRSAVKAGRVIGIEVGAYRGSR
jgi:hypothetical protein